MKLKQKFKSVQIISFSPHCAVAVHIYFAAQNSSILNLTANSPILLANSSISLSTIIVFARFFLEDLSDILFPSHHLLTLPLISVSQNFSNPPN